MFGPHDHDSYFQWGTLAAENGAIIFVTCPIMMVERSIYDALLDWINDPNAPTLFMFNNGGRYYVWIYWPDPGCEL